MLSDEENPNNHFIYCLACFWMLFRAADEKKGVCGEAGGIGMGGDRVMSLNMGAGNLSSLSLSENRRRRRRMGLLFPLARSTKSRVSRGGRSG